GFHGFEGSTSYAIPLSHVPEFFIKNFVGWTPRGTYWGANPIKLHSEYLGLPVVALAVLGAIARERRRLVLWVGGIGLLFLLISLGATTPFYKLWWALMPLVKKTRAPGMAFFVVAFVTAVFAALGVGAARLTPRLQALALILIVGTDLWLNARPFWSYVKPYGRDALIERVAATPAPYRVIDLGPAYPGSVLATFDVPQVLGYHGNELRYYEQLPGGQGEWTNLRYLALLA